MWQTFKHQFQRYLDLSNWIVRDSFAVFGKRLVAIQFERFVGVGLQLAVFGLLARYAQYLERDTSVRLFTLTFEPRDSATLLIIVASVAVLGLLAAAGLTYHSHCVLLRACQAYEHHCSRRVFERCGASFQPTTEAFKPDPPPTPITLSTTYPRYCALVIYRINNAVIPSCLVGLTTLPILFFLEPLLTGLVFLICIFSLALHYSNSIRNAAFCRSREHSTPHRTRLFLDFLDRIGRQLLPTHPSIIDKTLSDPTFTSPSEAYYRELDAIRRSQFLSELTIALTLGSILVLLGMDILRTGTGWGTLIIYLLALRMAMNHLTSLMRAVTTINRFYHQVRRYFIYLDLNADRVSTFPPRSGLAGESPKPFTTNEVLSIPPIGTPAGLPALADSLSQYQPRLGQRIAIFTHIPLTRLSSPAILDGLFPGSAAARDLLARHSAIIPESPILPEGYTWREAFRLSDLENDPVAALSQPSQGGDSDLPSRLRRFLPEDLNEVIDSDVDARLADDERCILACLIAARADSPCLMISATLLAGLSSEDRAFIGPLFSGKLLWLITDDADIVDRPDIDAAVILSPEGVIGVGSRTWVKTHQQRLAEHVAAWRVSSPPPASFRSDEADHDI